MALVPIFQVERAQMYEPYSVLWRAMLPELPKSPDMVQAEFSHAPDGAFDSNWVVLENDEVVGLASLWDEKNEDEIGLLFTEALFEPNVKIETVSKLLNEVIAKAKSVQAKEITSWTCTRSSLMVDYYVNSGWKHIQTVPFSRKRLEDSIPDDLRAKADLISRTGIEIRSVAELEKGGINWKRGLYDLTWEIAQDIPNPDEPTRLPFDQYSRMLDNKTLYDYELMFVAFDIGAMIGYSRVSPLGKRSKTVQTGMSGVLRSYRRMGVVTALKVRGFDSLRERGYEWVCTDNDETNAMYDLNQRLGFEKYAEFRAYKLVLN